MQDAEHQRQARKDPVEVIPESPECRAEDERHQQQEAKRENQRKAQQLLACDGDQRPARLSLHFPDNVESGLQFYEDSGRGDEERTGSDQRRDDAGPLVTGTGDHRLERLRPLDAHQIAKSLDDRAAACPNTSPATAMTRISIGAREKAM